MTLEGQIGKVLLFKLMRWGFRIIPMGEATRDRVRQYYVDRLPGLVPAGPPVVAPPPIVRRAWVRADEQGVGYVAHRRMPLPSPLPATLVAFYRTNSKSSNTIAQGQEDDLAIWRRTTRALPQFEGHAQPRLPSDLGFYDVRNPDTLCAQARLAADYGIGAFCFTFQWARGQALSTHPLHQLLNEATPQLPFCLIWDNARSAGNDDNVGSDCAQRDNRGDDLAFIEHVAAYFRDPRYLRVDGRPLLLVHDPELLEDSRQTTDRWREWCRDNDIGDIHLVCVQGIDHRDPRTIGFDAAVEFPPGMTTSSNLYPDQRLLNPDFQGEVLDWREMVADYSRRATPDYTLYPGVNTGWDDEPNRPGKGRVYLHSAPRRYRDWLQSTIRSRLANRPPSERLVFINAWNDWTVGATLEPDVALGHAWLHATREALHRAATPATTSLLPPKSPCAVIHAWYPDVLGELLDSLHTTGLPWRLVVTTTGDRLTEVRQVLLERGMQAEVEVVQNHGRDILPFLRVANRLLDEGVEIVLKLHTKRSLHRPDGDDWRRDILTRLAAPDRAVRIHRAFEREPALGMVGPEGHLLPLAEFWGENVEAVQYLAGRAGLPPPSSDETFVAGSMFWARLEALRPLLDSRLESCDFEPEAGQLDGTLAHAVERVMAAWATRAGFRVMDAASVSGDALPDVTKEFHATTEPKKHHRVSPSRPV